jgi:MFS family permease
MFRELTKHQRFVLIIAWLGWVFDVMEASFFGLTKQAMMKEMLGAAEYARIGTEWEGRIHGGMIIGWALGGLIFGIVADKWGRGKTLLLTVFIYCVFTGLTSLCQTPSQVLGARFLTGLGIGGEWAAGAALIAETVPNHFRARAAAFLQTAAAFGSIIGVFVSIGAGNANWRWVYVAGILPAVLCFVARFRLEGNEKTPKNWGVSETPVEPVGLLESPELSKATTAPTSSLTLTDFPNSGGESSTNPLFQLLTTRPYNIRLLAAVLIGVVGIAGGGILPFWLPNLVKDALPGATDATVAYYKNLTMIVLHLGTLAGVLVFPPLTDRYGRRPLFAGFFVASGLMLYLTATQAVSLPLLFILPPLTSFFALGVTAGFGLYFPELFTTQFRATGSGIAYNSARILIAPLQVWIGVNAKTQGVGPTIGLVAMIYVIGLVGLSFAPETRGKKLEI